MRIPQDNKFSHRAPYVGIPEGGIRVSAVFQFFYPFKCGKLSMTFRLHKPILSGIYIGYGIPPKKE
jgi:hypothetical protein